MNRKYSLLLGIGAVLALSPACRHTSPNAGKSPAPLAIEIGFDPTPPNADARARVGAATIPAVAFKSDGFVLRATDNKTSIIATTVPQDEDITFLILKGIIRDMIPVTDLCHYLEILVDTYAHSDKKVLILVYTDGLDDGNPKDAARRIGKAASALAANPNVVAVTLVGTIRDTRANWEGLPEMLAPLKGKLQIIPQAQMTPENILREVKAIKASVGCR